MGSTIHALIESLNRAILSDRILILYRHNGMYWGDHEFCDNSNQNIMCYLQPITNCSVSDEDINLARHNNQPFITETHAHIKYPTELEKHPTIPYVFCPYIDNNQRTVPPFIKDLFKLNKFPVDRLWYWRIQGATFVTRLNERTMNWIREYEKKTCKECENEFDISLHIRHADKGSEMTLIKADVYKEAIKIITSLGMKKNYTIYVNADDQKSVDIIHSLPYHTVSLSQQRGNKGVWANIRVPHVALISFANLHIQIRADHCLGTIQSNWCRLIYMLKLTVGMKSDGFVLEVGYPPCSLYSECTFKNKHLQIEWW